MYYTHTYMYIYIYIHPSQPFRETELSIITANTHLTTLFNHLQPATSTGAWSFFEGGWLVHHGWPIYVDSPKPRFPTSSHRVTNSKVMWDEPRWIQHQHSLKNTQSSGGSRNATVDGWNKGMDSNSFWMYYVFLCFCFHKTFSQNFWTFSGWIWVKLVPKFHLAIPRDSCWRVVTTSLPKWVDLIRELGFVVMNIHHHHPSLK